MKRQQAVMTVVAFTVTVLLFVSGHLRGAISVGVARSVLPEPSGWLKITGDVRFSGIYPADANAMTRDVIFLASPLCGIPATFDAVPATSGSDLRITCTSHDSPATVTITPMSSPERLVLNIPIDLNHATAADLEKIPGIGPVMAERIVRFRQNNGAFARVEELTMVPGIGDKKLAQLSPYFQVIDIKAKP